MMNKSIEEIVEFLIDKKLTELTTAESCTGGHDRICERGYSGVSVIFTMDSYLFQ